MDELTSIEKARAARLRNIELRKQGLLPPLPPRKVRAKVERKRGRPQSLDERRKIVTEEIREKGLSGITGEFALRPAELLSVEQLQEIRRKARERVEAELRQLQEANTQDLVKQALEAETLRLRREHGLTNHLDDIVKITINCPPYANCYLIDGTPYHHGFTYDVPRRKYNDLKEAMARGWDAEERAGWPNAKFKHDPSLRGPVHTQNPMGLVNVDPQDGHIVSRETVLSAVGGVTKGMPTNTAMSGGL